MAGSAAGSYLQDDLIGNDDQAPRSRTSAPSSQSYVSEDDSHDRGHTSNSYQVSPRMTTNPRSGLTAKAGQPAATLGAMCPGLGVTHMPRTAERQFVLALDFGTTSTGVAFASFEGTVTRQVELPTIEVVRNWGPGMNNMDKVPSVISCTKNAHGELQWGSNMSEDAKTLINQKLELGLQDSTLGELDLTEYLRRVFRCTRDAIHPETLRRTSTPVDLVLTMPRCWSYQAKNTFLRAATAAGFNSRDIPTLRYSISVSEPEAAAYYTSRESPTGSLKAGKCFVLCDAGGGTVDAVAFRVVQLRPFPKLHRATAPTGSKCGSALIDTEFKRWLRRTLGEEHYVQLDPASAKQRAISPCATEDGPMRRLIKNFHEAKHTFSNDNRATINIKLPAPLNRLRIPERVNDGELLISWREMKEIMDACVKLAVGLICEQVDQVARTTETEVKTIFLVGGFAASPYLQEEFGKKFEMLDINVVHPGRTSLTAVVQGAVIHGLERPWGSKTQYLVRMTKTFGYVDNGHNFRWFTKRGDLIMEGKPIISYSDSFWIQPPPRTINNVLMSTIVFRLFSFDDDGEDAEQELPIDWRKRWNDVQTAGVVKMTRRDLYRGTESEVKQDGLTGPFKWRVTVDGPQLYADLLLNEKSIGTCSAVETKYLSTRNNKPSAGPYDEDDG